MSASDSFGRIVPLDFLRAGECGRVAQIEGSEQLVIRLEEMGLRRGVRIEMIRPGSPCIVAFDNHRLSFRGDESAVVMVGVVG